MNLPGDSEDEAVDPAPETLSQRLWASPGLALQFLMHMQIVMLPARCEHGHMWKPYFSSFNSSFCSCKTNFDEPIEDEFGNAAGTKVKFCTAKKISWRELPGSFVQKMPNSIGPQAMLRLLWWFSQRLPIEQIMEYTCLSAYSVREGFVQIRKAIGVKIISLQGGGMLGKRLNTSVCLDET